MSTLKVNAIQNTSGVEQYLAKAWVRFNGTGTVAINGSGNVSSITDGGVGTFQINFTSAFADTNYAVVSNTNGYTTNLTNAAATGNCSVITAIPGTGATDNTQNHVAIFR